jgi:hypothetical protein
MQTGLHAFSWSLPRLGIGLAMIVGMILVSYIVLVAVIVVARLRPGSGISHAR